MLAVASCPVLFSAERWVTAWRAVGGYLTIGEGPFGAGGEFVPVLLEMLPQPLVEAWDSPRRVEGDRLRALIAWPPARAAVIDYLRRRQATSSFGG